MCWLTPASRLAHCALLCLLAVYGSTVVPAVQAHGKHKPYNATKVLQVPGTVGDVQLPVGGALSAWCVPKYTSTLVVPPPMPANTSPRPKSREGPGCFKFADFRPPYCSKYGQPDPYNAYPYAEAAAAPEGAPAVARQLDANAQARRRHGYTPDKEEHYRGEHHHNEPYRGDRPYPGNKPYPSQQHPGKHYPGEHYYGGPPRKPSYPVPDYAKHHNRRNYDHADDYPADKPYYRLEPRPHVDSPYDQPPYDGYPGDQPYGDDYHGSDYAPPPECTVDCFTEYQISVKPHPQRALPLGRSITPPQQAGQVDCPASFGQTKVFAYGPTDGDDLDYNWPAFTIEAQRYRPNRIQWNNELVEQSGPNKGNFVQHILKEAVDQTIHWANPEALGGSVDSNPCANCIMPPNNGICPQDAVCKDAAARTEYVGPVPIVTHVHGMEDVRDYSDGYTEAWYLPDAKNLRQQVQYTKVGTWYDTFEEAYFKDTCQPYSRDGSADFIYPNTQRPSTAWYHDHTLGLTRLNVYSGMAGFYFIRDFLPVYRLGVQDTGPELPGLPYPPPSAMTLASDVREIPLAIQDRMFKKDGSLWYPVKAPDAANNIPNGPLHPIWVPEFPFVTPNLAGEEYVLMTVNGKTWPKTTLMPDAYRLRLLNGCNARTLKVQFAKTGAGLQDFNYGDTGSYTNVRFYVIGNEAGFFPQAQGPYEELTMGPAERYDVIIDFSTFGPSDNVYMYNSGPEAPFQNGNIGPGPRDQPPSTLQTSQLMRFEFNPELSNKPVQPFTATCLEQLNAALAKKYPQPLPAATRRRRMALIEDADQNSNVKAVLLGTVPANPPTNTATKQMWDDQVTTTTPVETVEEWEIINLTKDAHPIHLHEVVYETVGRRGITVDPVNPLTFTYNNDPTNNDFLDPYLWLTCPTTISTSGTCPANRDVSLILPNFATTIKFKTGKKPGLFVWHCHIVEHEDNEMMVPWCIGPPDYFIPKTNTRMCPTITEFPTLVKPLP